MNSVTMKSLRLKLRSPEQTQLLGMHLGELAIQGDVFLLVGELGTGKTCLVQGIVQGLGIKQYAFSPTFIIIREYHGRLPLYHIDLYRLDDVEEIADLGLDEEPYTNGICAIEWADKGLNILPEQRLLIQLSYNPDIDTERTAYVMSKGKRYDELVTQLKAILSKENSWN